MKSLNITEKAKTTIRRLFSQRYSVNTLKHDPELTAIFDNFAYDESLALTEGPVLEKTRVMCILASTIGCGSKLEFRNYVDACLNVGVKPREIREVVYQDGEGSRIYRRGIRQGCRREYVCYMSEGTGIYD